jgi:hypothetical protein
MLFLRIHGSKNRVRVAGSGTSFQFQSKHTTLDKSNVFTQQFNDLENQLKKVSSPEKVADARLIPLIFLVR